MITRLFLESKDSYLNNNPNKYFIKACQHIDFVHGKALDLGCGTGANLLYLKDKFNMYPEGCDINPDNFVELNTKHDLNIIQCKIQEYPFKMLYDIIVCFNVFMWLSEEEQRDLLAQIRDHLTPRGVFVFSIMTNWNKQPRNVISDNEIEHILNMKIVYSSNYKQGDKKFRMMVFRR